MQQVLDVRGLGNDYASGAVAGREGVPPGAGGSDASPQPTDAQPSPEPVPPTTGPSFTSQALSVRALDPSLFRADIEFHNVAHAGASYEGRVYINNPDANAYTGYDHPSYAGSYRIFGHGGCLGAPGHCDVQPRNAGDPRTL